MSRRKGDWIQTYTGKQFWPLDPRPEDLDIVDIAHALSLTCRFTGHCRSFYSVAQHSVLASGIVGTEHRLAALLHDASEAYMADVSRPVKRFMPDYKTFESNLDRCIAERFGLTYPMHPEVKAADNQMLATEQRDLMLKSSAVWTSLDGVPLLPFTITPIGSVAAEREFLAMFRFLTNDGERP